MKKFFIAVVAFAACIGAYAQDKGNISVGGVIGVSGGSFKVDGSKPTTNPVTFKFNPMGNLFVANDLEVSAGLNYEMTNTRTKIDDVKASETWNIAQFQMGLHYYVPIVWGVLYYTPGINLGIGGGTLVNKVTDNPKSVTLIPLAVNFEVNFGKFEFQPDVRWGVTVNVFDLCVAYKKVKYADKKLGSTGVDCGFNYGASVGVKYYF